MSLGAADLRTPLTLFGQGISKVSFTGPSGVRHSVDVTAESVYEAAALGLARLRRGGVFIEALQDSYSQCA
jgi:hypothetical protein